MITSELPEHRHRAHDRGHAAAPLGPGAGVPGPAGGDRRRAPWTAAGAAADAGPDRPAGGRPAAAALPERPAPRSSCPRHYLRALDAMHAEHQPARGDPRPTPTELVPELERSVHAAGVQLVARPAVAASTGWTARRTCSRRPATSVRVQPGNFTFSSRSGTIPVTVANELDPGGRGRAAARPADPAPARRARSRPFTIGPQSKLQIPVPASAVASGPVVVDAQLHTAGGAAYGQPVPLRISITQYGTVALYITAVAAGVLFLAAGVRVLRRVVAARRQRAGPAGGRRPGRGQRSRCRDDQRRHRRSGAGARERHRPPTSSPATAP